jgi:hypothetical protein
MVANPREGLTMKKVTRSSGSPVFRTSALNSWSMTLVVTNNLRSGGNVRAHKSVERPAEDGQGHFS